MVGCYAHCRQLNQMYKLALRRKQLKDRSTGTITSRNSSIFHQMEISSWEGLVSTSTVSQLIL